MTYYGKQMPMHTQYPEAAENLSKKQHPCPHKPGTLLRIFIPAGATINLANLIEVGSPSGICLIIRISLLSRDLVNSVVTAVKDADGSVEFL